MFIINKIRHLISFEAKANRTEFALVYLFSYAQFGLLFYFKEHDVEFNIGAVGFLAFLAFQSYLFVALGSVVCRRTNDIGISLNYVLYWFISQFAAGLLASLSGSQSILGLLALIVGFAGMAYSVVFTLFLLFKRGR